jgi:molybdenum cofactor cytidylyltransferase
MVQASAPRGDSLWRLENDGERMRLAQVSIVILAAGGSSRLGRPKQLLQLGGEPLLRHTIRHALASRANDVIVVLGNEADAIAEAVGDLGQRTVVNPAYVDGQSTSLVAGIRAVDPGADAALLMLGDQPTVETTVLDRLIERFAASGAEIVQPVYDGTPGNPVIFRRDLFPELLAVTGDQGARQVIRSRSERIDRIDADQPVPPDVDTEADYGRLIELWAELGS